MKKQIRFNYFVNKIRKSIFIGMARSIAEAKSLIFGNDFYLDFSEVHEGAFYFGDQILTV